MSNFTRFKISLVAALVISMMGGTAAKGFPAKQNIFFPSQALHTDFGTDDEALTVVRSSDRIEISFRIVEVLRNLFK